MTYADDLNNERLPSQFLVRLNGRTPVNENGFVQGSLSGMPNPTRTFYYDTTDYESIAFIKAGANFTYTRTVNKSLLIDCTDTEGNFYYDYDLKRVYLQFPTATPFPLGFNLYLEYSLFYSTEGVTLAAEPRQFTTETELVFWRPLLVNQPAIEASSEERLFGYAPTRSVVVQISNEDRVWYDRLYSDSFNKTKAYIWHYKGYLADRNPNVESFQSDITRVFVGEIGGSILLTDQTVDFTLFDSSQIFDREFRIRLNYDGSAPSSSFFPGGIPIPLYYGKVEGVQFRLDDATPFRYFVGQTDNRLVKTVGAGTTTTKVYVGVSGDTNGIENGGGLGGFNDPSDVVYWVEGNESSYVTNVGSDGGGNYVIVTPAFTVAPTPGHTIQRPKAGSVFIADQNGAPHGPLLYSRHYTETDVGADYFYIDINSANINTDFGFTPDDSSLVWGRVYGLLYPSTSALGRLAVTVPPFGASDSAGMSDGVSILWHILRIHLGLPESEFNKTSWEDLDLNFADHNIGFSVGSLQNQSYPTFRELVADITKSCLLNIYQNNGAVWEISSLGPFSSDNDIVPEATQAEISYEFDYRDIFSDFVIKYNNQQIGRFGGQSGGFNQISVTNQSRAELHNIDRTLNIKTLHTTTGSATSFANRISYILGERKGVANLRTYSEYFQLLIGNQVAIESELVPGFKYTEGVDRQRSYKISSTTKRLNEIALILDDQKGIEDNSGSW